MTTADRTMRVVEIVGAATQTSRDLLAGGTRVADLAGWDSLAALKVLMELEAEFGGRLDPVAVFNSATIDELTDLLAKDGSP